MRNFFRKKKDSPLELISIHIPKTAGTSFRLILEGVYGENEITRLDIPLTGKRVKVNATDYTQSSLPRTKVYHGHFRLRDLRDMFELDAAPPVITWLRHPVDRVVSNYYYLRERLMDELDEEGKGLNILSKMMRSLEEYAEQDINRNRMSKFLEGTKIEDFDFIGIMESFDDDVAELAKLLGWGGVRPIHVNRTTRKAEIEEGLRERIAELNGDDMALYEHVLTQKTGRP
jgi:hypothetical protein